jgi:hypothetical protein
LTTYTGYAAEGDTARGLGGRPWLAGGVTITGRLGSTESTAVVEPRAFTTGLMRAAQVHGAVLRHGTVVDLVRRPSGAVRGPSYWLFRCSSSARLNTASAYSATRALVAMHSMAGSERLLVQQVAEIIPSFRECLINARRGSQCSFGFDIADNAPEHVSEIERRRCIS